MKMVDKEAAGRSSNRSMSSNLIYYLLDSAVETVERPIIVEIKVDEHLILSKLSLSSQ